MADRGGDGRWSDVGQQRQFGAIATETNFEGGDEVNQVESAFSRPSSAMR